jgi:hypothetical protein
VRRAAGLVAGLAFGLGLTGCGARVSSGAGAASPAAAVSATTAAAALATSAAPAPAVAELPQAEHPSHARFPAVQGRTLRQMAELSHSTAQLTAATGFFTSGTDRYAFSLAAGSGRYVYAPTAVYIATSPAGRAEGPFVAPADPLTVAPAYRSAQNSGPFGIKAIYDTAVPLPRPGLYALLALTRGRHGLIAASGEIAVAPSSPIPAVGQRPPAVATDTAASVRGDLSLLTTRTPAESMHSVAFDQVLGRRPVALLFSTPQLCTSRVCGPVTDIMVELQRRFGSRITFIHQEVFVDNDPAKGLRPQMRAFGLETEPWLFTVNRRGTIAARLDGAFGVNEARAALEAALR